MKKLLLVTYHFPPDTAVGAIRPARFAKFLPEFGWEPIILTVKEKYYYALTQSPSDSNSRLHAITRTTMLRSPSYYYRKIKSILRVDEQGPSRSSAGGPNAESARVDIRQAISELLSFPDEFVGWLPFAVISGIKAIRKTGISVLVTSAPPPSVHLIGACLSRLARIPWIADFRDPWKDPFGIRRLHGFRRQWDDKLETLVLSSADKVTAVSQRMNGDFLKRHPELPEEKFLLIPNGFDPEDFENIVFRRKRNRTKLVISHVGSLYGPRNPRCFLAAVCSLVDEGAIESNRLELQFVGDCSSDLLWPSEDFVAKLKSVNVLKLIPAVPHAQALDYMNCADVLLLIGSERSGEGIQVTSKLFEYLKLKKPIFALVPENTEVVDILNSVRASYYRSELNSEDSIKANLKTIYAKFNDGTLFDHCRRQADLNTYNRQNLTGRFADVLNQAVEEKRVI